MKNFFSKVYWKIRRRLYGYESPYCKLCDSCGHDGCCNYLICTLEAIKNNKGCFYPETYKDELLLRDEFYELCMSESERTPEIEKFVNEIYSKAYDKQFKK